MPVFPVALLIEEAPLPRMKQSLHSFNVEAINVDEAEGKAGRVARRLFPGKPYLVKVNREGRPLEPETIKFIED